MVIGLSGVVVCVYVCCGCVYRFVLLGVRLLCENFGLFFRSVELVHDWYVDSLCWMSS